MALTPLMRARRHEIEAIYKESEKTEVDEREEIRKSSIESFTKKLDGKLKNLQEGEGLIVHFSIDIVGSDGIVRGGSGSERNMPEYKEWRDAVYQRDKYTCQECGAKGRLNAHHIKGWSGHPELRFDVSNGISLCEDCHKNKHPHLKLFKSRKSSKPTD